MALETVRLKLKLKSYFIFSLVAWSQLCTIAAAQPTYRVSFQQAAYTFYCGIVDVTRLDVIDLSGKNRPVKFQALSEGASLEYDSGVVLVLPRRKEFTIRIYGEVAGRLYFAGEITARCKEPPADDGIFKTMFPNPKKELKNVNHFSIEGRKTLNDPDIRVLIGTGPITELKEGERNRLALRVVRVENGESHTRWDNYEVQSSDAEITKEDRQFFSITPKPGLRKCTVSVFLGKNKIGEQTFRISKY